MSKKNQLTKERILEIIAPTVENLKRDFPEWGDEETDRLVEMLKPYSEVKIRQICLLIAKTPLVEKVVSHRSKHGAESVISEEAKAKLSQSEAEKTED